MNVVVDTSVWSLVLRRDAVDERNVHVRAFRECIGAGHWLSLLGPILQELLDGLRSQRQFSRLLAVLEPVPLIPLHRSTYILAAQIRKDCRRKGIQAGRPTDFLIAAACVEYGYPLLAADRNFERIASNIDLVLIPAPAN